MAERDLTGDAASWNPEVGLRAVSALRKLAEQLEALQVQNAREQGWTWEAIANELGVSKQAVHKKHGAGDRLEGLEKGLDRVGRLLRLRLSGVTITTPRGGFTIARRREDEKGD